MGVTTKIEWADATWTPIRAINRETGKVGWHCEHVTEACRNCYAERLNKRLGTGLEFRRQDRDAVEIILDADMLTAPLRWRKPRKIFVCSMTDLFADFVTDAMIDRMFAVMALAPQHIFQVLTKRPTRMRQYLLSGSSIGICGRIADAAAALASPTFTDADLWTLWPLPNVWLGVSVHDQPSADEFIPLLLDTPAAKRFISYEPALGGIDLRHVQAPRSVPEDAELDWKFDVLAPGDYYEFKDDRGTWCSGDGPHREHAIDWVIAGGESGPGARPAHPDWFRSVASQCAAAGVPFHFKQRGAWTWVGNEEFDAEQCEQLFGVEIKLVGARG
jgi:protein gp37